MLFAIVFLVSISTSVDVWVANFILPNYDCTGNSPFILRYDNDTCTPTKCVKGEWGMAINYCQQPDLGNYARVRKFKDDTPGDCAIQWSDGYPLLDSCQNFTSLGMGYLMMHCDGKNLIQTKYPTHFCQQGKEEGVVSHYLQDTCVVDGFGDNDMFVKFGRCGV